MANTKEEVDVAKMYGEECTLPRDEFIKNYKVNPNGLSDTQATKRIEKLGLNEPFVTVKLSNVAIFDLVLVTDKI